SHSLHNLNSPLGHIGFVDRKFQTKNLSFLPHAIDSTLQKRPEEERFYDVVIFDGLVDTDDLEKNWEELFATESVDFLHVVAKKCQVNPTLLPLAVICETMEEMHIEGGQNYFLFLIEEYLKA